MKQHNNYYNKKCLTPSDLVVLKCLSLALIVRAKFCFHSNQWEILQTSMRKRLDPSSAEKSISLCVVTLMYHPFQLNTYANL